MPLPLLRSSARPLGRSGQFIPIAAMMIFTSIILLYAVTNIYRVTRAKLQAQNLADAAALAIAAMEAKSINTVLDRDEWLNHMYTDAQLQHPNGNMLPGISNQANGKGNGNGNSMKQMPNSEAQNYAQLVYTINTAQQMFSQAYNNFLGAIPDGASGVQAMNGGAGSLSDILSEITGLQDPSVVQVIVFNSQNDSTAADQLASQTTKNPAALNGNSGGSVPVVGQMHAVKFITEEVPIKQDKGGWTTLSKVLFPNGPNDVAHTVGWMHPDWDNSPTLDITSASSSSGKQKQIGAGAIVIKRVSLPYFKTVLVQAKSTAYVVRQSGLSVSTTDPTKPPDHFRPTYYVQLGYK